MWSSQPVKDIDDYLIGLDPNWSYDKTRFHADNVHMDAVWLNKNLEQPFECISISDDKIDATHEMRRVTYFTDQVYQYNEFLSWLVAAKFVFKNSYTDGNETMKKIYEKMDYVYTLGIMPPQHSGSKKTTYYIRIEPNAPTTINR
jgi:hypothetical protein